MSGIRKQVDSDYEGDNMVAFLRASPCYRKSSNVLEDRVSGETYNVEVHRKPLDASGRAYKYCSHEHRSIDSAVRCAKKLMRLLRRELGVGA